MRIWLAPDWQYIVTASTRAPRFRRRPCACSMRPSGPADKTTPCRPRFQPEKTNRPLARPTAAACIVGQVSRWAQRVRVVRANPPVGPGKKPPDDPAEAVAVARVVPPTSPRAVARSTGSCAVPSANCHGQCATVRGEGPSQIPPLPRQPSSFCAVPRGKLLVRPPTSRGRPRLGGCPTLKKARALANQGQPDSRLAPVADGRLLASLPSLHARPERQVGRDDGKGPATTMPAGPAPNLDPCLHSRLQGTLGHGRLSADVLCFLGIHGHRNPNGGQALGHPTFFPLSLLPLPYSKTLIAYRSAAISGSCIAWTCPGRR